MLQQRQHRPLNIRDCSAFRELLTLIKSSICDQYSIYWTFAWAQKISYSQERLAFAQSPSGYWYEPQGRRRRRRRRRKKRTKRKFPEMMERCWQALEGDEKIKRTETETKSLSGSSISPTQRRAAVVAAASPTLQPLVRYYLKAATPTRKHASAAFRVD